MHAAEVIDGYPLSVLVMESMQPAGSLEYGWNLIIHMDKIYTSQSLFRQKPLKSHLLAADPDPNDRKDLLILAVRSGGST